ARWTQRSSVPSPFVSSWTASRIPILVHCALVSSPMHQETCACPLFAAAFISSTVVWLVTATGSLVVNAWVYTLSETMTVCPLHPNWTFVHCCTVVERPPFAVLVYVSVGPLLSEWWFTVNEQLVSVCVQALSQMSKPFDGSPVTAKSVVKG